MINRTKIYVFNILPIGTQYLHQTIRVSYNYILKMNDATDTQTTFIFKRRII